MQSEPIVALIIGLSVLAAAAILVWPKSGLIARRRRAKHLNRRILAEDALKFTAGREADGKPVTLEDIAGALDIDRNRAAATVDYMIEADLLVRGERGLCLTETGRAAALHLIRAHRLWESYLAEKTGYEPEEWHERADVREHSLSDERLGTISQELGNPRFDPDGDPIPRGEDDEKIRHTGVPLTAKSAGESVRVVHVEDEPSEVYAQLLAMGIHTGSVLEVLANSPKQTRIWANNGEHVLSPVLAANVAVQPVEPTGTRGRAPLPGGTVELSQALDGEPVRVVQLSEVCRGAERRRFLDLGLVPGTVVVPEYRSPSGDPRAYRIRETIIALRDRQASKILVSPVEEAKAATVPQAQDADSWETTDE